MSKKKGNNNVTEATKAETSMATTAVSSSAPSSVPKV